jgi:AraC-like DNA-binding protein
MNAASASFTPSKNNHSASSNSGVGFQLCRLNELPTESAPHSVVLRYLLKGGLRCRLHHFHFALEQDQYLLANPAQSFMLTSANLQADTQVLRVEIPVQAIEAGIEKADPGLNLGRETFLDRKRQISFCEGSYAGTDDNLGASLRNLAYQLSEPGLALSAEYHAQEIINHLLTSQNRIFAHINRLTSAKLSTKKELYRRLLQARDYIHENLHTNLDLDTLSQVACLSKFHFIRLFKEVFEVTPRQYLISRRLERARKMLLNTSKSFHEICLEVGLKDSSSFGRLFKKNYGATPHIYRRQYAQVG